MQVFLVGIVNFQVYSEVSVCKSQFDKKKKPLYHSHLVQLEERHSI